MAQLLPAPLSLVVPISVELQPVSQGVEETLLTSNLKGPGGGVLQSEYKNRLE